MGVEGMGVELSWRGDVATREVNELHAEAFSTRVFDDAEWPWADLLQRHSLGWVTARDAGRLVGFVNVPWDGLVHAWVQDVMVGVAERGQGLGTRLVSAAAEGARQAGCEWLHVDFDAELGPFYLDACGFSPTGAGLLRLSGD
jgi:GNAT superfamily N-acetyltransferase